MNYVFIILDSNFSCAVLYSTVQYSIWYDTHSIPLNNKKMLEGLVPDWLLLLPNLLLHMFQISQLLSQGQ